MTINYTPTTGIAGLGGYAVSITDPTGVPYPTGVTASISTSTISATAYYTTYGAAKVPVILFQIGTTVPFTVGQTVAISGTTNFGTPTPYDGINPFNGFYYKVYALSSTGTGFYVLNTNTPFQTGTVISATTYTLTVLNNFYFSALPGFSPAPAGTFVGLTIFSGSSFGVITSTAVSGSNFVFTVSLSWGTAGTPTAGASFSIYHGAGTTGGLATLSYAPQTRTFPIDTSFEPYRREAFRHRSIPAQREAIQMTNIMGEGTVNTEGLWRREQREWFMGAGQQYLDHKDDDQQARFYSSKGIDVFSYPYQAKLLPDTYRVDAASGTPPSNLMTASANGYMVVGSSTGSAVTLQYFTGISTLGSAWSGATTLTFGTTYGGTTPTILYGMASANSYLYIATNTGIWFCQPGVSNFQLFAGNDGGSSFTGYNMIAWANDQLIAGSGNRLYAFQPRSATNGPLFGSSPSTTIISSKIASISNNYPTATLTIKTNTPIAVQVGQTINLSGTASNGISPTSSSVSGGGSWTITIGTIGGTISPYFGANVGDTITVDFGYTSGIKRESVKVISSSISGTGTSQTQTITFNSTQATTTTSLAGILVYGQSGSGFDGIYTVSGVTNSENFSVSYNSTNVGGGVPGIGASGAVGTSVVPDLLYTHQDSSWVWSSAVGGETQVYFAGYTNHSGAKGNGCIYRSDLLGSSTTSSTNTQTITTAQVAQPWQLVSPVQALPMSPDEYPTCIQSYLNFIFIGTNRGIRMAQTLSVYDPTATATGDLKSGPLIPNILQPLTNPVTAIIGDGRFVWFAWNNYDGSSTGLGKLDLSTYIAGDPLAPAYASDLMVTGQGTINSLAWNPVLNIPVIAVGGQGVYQPYATNTNGIITATQYVTSGILVTSIFDYGIPDQKAPVYFEYGGQAQNGTGITASVVCEPLESLSGQTLTVAQFQSPTGLGTAIKEYPLSSNPKSSQFQVYMTLTSTATNNYNTSPIMYRWTLKAFPNVVSGTNISAVLQLFSVDVVDGQEVFIDPYDNFYWLESLRQAQNLITYTEGPLSSTVSIIESLDWIPHKRRDNYENGYEGDCVITIKTLGPYTYTPQYTN